ncbi:hypothetical protein SDC9_160706 [bioreactor metagenome]|uniref:Uncharacterized protein n=1 Tax=bioreactor metagenome TaxID=1076179 RepID=A0A645FG52_9ZZZZ
MRMTVSIVPSLGRITALYAASEPARKASANMTASISTAPLSRFEMPLNIWESMTPEFPRAPFKAPSDNAAATSDILPVLAPCISFTALCIVMSILVPVSPSGTGNTFSASMALLFFSNRAAPIRNISLKIAPVMVNCVIVISSVNARP